MAKKNRVESELIQRLKDGLSDLREALPTLPRSAVNRTGLALSDLVAEIEATKASLDPIVDPGSAFDPSDPDTAGRLVTLALLAQERVPLGRLAKSYGSGVYAIYYTGDHPDYLPVSNTETPVYVGKADPKKTDAKSPREQGPQLFGRLADHRRMIKTVEAFSRSNAVPNPLRIDDFECRRMVCATNAQLVAERHLINLFRPVWNSEMKICWGISMHGDGVKRSNDRPPWDVMHPGRAWTQKSTLVDSMPLHIIREKLAHHFAENPPPIDRLAIVEQLMANFTQKTPIVASLVEADADDEAVAHDPSIQSINE